MAKVEQGKYIDLGVREQGEVREPCHTHHIVVQDAITASSTPTHTAAATGNPVRCVTDKIVVKVEYYVK